jgi:hypothetical protein
MNDTAKELRKRMVARGPNGEHLSLLAGNESLAELQAMIIEFTQLCPAGKNHDHCPFHMLSGLSYASLTRLVNNMSHESCLDLFEQERNCRFQADARGQHVIASAEPGLGQNPHAARQAEGE